MRTDFIQKMKNNVMVVILISVVIVSIATSQVSGETIRLTNGEWSPFTSEKKLQYHGILSRIVTEAFALEGVKVEYGFYPWKRSLHYAKSGDWDGSIGWAAGRADLIPDFVFSNPTITIPKYLFSLKDKSVRWNTMDDLQGKKIGVAASYFYGEAFERAKQKGIFTVQEVPKDELNIKKLLSGRFDAFAMEIDTALYLMQTALSPEDTAKIMYDPHILLESQQCVIFSKKHERSSHFVEVFNRGLQRLKESGKYDQYITESRQGKYLTILFKPEKKNYCFDKN
jgi:polar amino acid transport system substrate-binding protein